MKFRDTETGEIFHFTVNEALEEINRDRSTTWRNYKRHDWRDGLEWTTLEIVRI